MRRVLPVLSALVLLGALTACSSGDPAPSPSSTSATASVNICDTKGGSAVDGVKVSTDLGTPPTAQFEKGLSTSTTERKVVVQGDGPVLEQGGYATVAYSAWDATSGAQFDSYGYTSDQVATFKADATQVLIGLAKTIGCVKQGSRVVSVVSPEDAFGSAGYEQLGIKPGDTVIFVVDLKQVVPTKADGAAQPAQEGFPTVKLAADGQPTVTIPKDLAKPTDLKLEVLKKGTGATVAEGDTVTVQYQGVDFDTGKVFDQSWTKGGPTQFATTQVVQGFGQALVGQTVGSQVVAVIPPALAYGEAGESNTSELAGKTLVFVIDILATQKG